MMCDSGGGRSQWHAARLPKPWPPCRVSVRGCRRDTDTRHSRASGGQDGGRVSPISGGRHCQYIECVSVYSWPRFGFSSAATGARRHTPAARRIRLARVSAVSARQTHAHFHPPMAAPSARLSGVIAALESLLARDPGGRSIVHITLPGQLLPAARAFVAARAVRVDVCEREGGRHSGGRWRAATPRCQWLGVVLVALIHASNRVTHTAFPFPLPPRVPPFLTVISPPPLVSPPHRCSSSQASHAASPTTHPPRPTDPPGRWRSPPRR